MVRLRKVLLCCFIVASLAGTSTGYAADKWLSIRSQNFLLVGNASESSIRRVARDLEEFRAGMALLFPSITKQAPPPMTVLVFKDDASFLPYKPLYQGKPANVAGYFQSGQDMNFIALTAGTQTPRVIYHEFLHALTKDLTIKLPVWASEGLAEVYSTFEIESNGKEMLLGRAIGEHLQTLKQSFISINALFAVTRGSPYYNEQTKQGIFYAESWAVMHYLMLANNQQRRPQLVKFLALAGDGNKSIDDSFSEAFETDYASFEQEMRAYVGHFAFPAVLFKLQSKIDFDHDMQTATLSEAQVQYYLGDLMLHTDRTDMAEAQLQRAISLDPNFSPSYASLGFLRVRQGKNDEALEFLGKAVEADSKNYMAHYYYAFTLQSAGSKTTKVPDTTRLALMREHLKKTVELQPDFWPAYDMLGYDAIVSREELPQTEELLKKALTAAPGKRDIRIRLAEVMIANNEPLAGRVILSPLKNITDDDAVQRRAQSLLNQIQTMIDNETAVREYNERRAQAQAQAQTQAEVRAEAQAKAAAAARNSAGNDTPDGPPVIRRNETTPSTEAKDAAPKQAVARPAGKQIQGALLSVDCSQGMTLRVRVGNGNVELHASDPSKINFVSYTSAVSNSFACGQFKTPPPVLIIYKAGTDPRFLGEPIQVEFTGTK
ncbi:MAG TPA: tetratricopeptide repeat protein [Terriglobia bacterium]|jgi:tetratricopeptide (TPR) repeat protein